MMPRSVSVKSIVALIFAALYSAGADAGNLLANLTASPPAIVDASQYFTSDRWYLNSDNGHLYYQFSDYPWEDRGAAGQLLQQSNGPDVWVWNFSNLTVRVRLTIYGAHPAVIMSPGSVVVDAPIIVQAGGMLGGLGAANPADGSNGAGATSGAGGQGGGHVVIVGNATPWGWDYAFAGGGGGGGFASAGESGYASHPVLAYHWDGNQYVADPPAVSYRGGAGGAAYAAFTVLAGGGGGGAGGSGSGYSGAPAGGNGGNGGGAILFATSGDFTISANGSISADGSDAAYFDGGNTEASGGGGAGGYVGFNIAGTWRNDGTVSAHGGAGSYCRCIIHQGATAPTRPGDQMGGSGSGGYVAINPAAIVNVGQINVSGGSTAASSAYGGSVLLDAPSIIDVGQITGSNNTVSSTPIITSTTSTSTTSVATTTTTTQAPAAALNFTQGWNLAGNGSTAAIDVAASFSDPNRFLTAWKWIGAQAVWAFYAPSLAAQGGTVLADYVASKGYQLLTTIAGGEGFWVNAKQAGSVNLPAGNAISVASLVPTLVRGWNLAAVGESVTPKQFCDAQSSGVTTLWTWDPTNAAWYFYAPSLDAKGGTALTDYISSKGYLDFTANSKTLGPGLGFWVNKL